MKHTHTYDHYYLYGEITGIMQDWAEKLPGYTRLTKIGTSYEGRDILLMEITDLSTGAFEDKPAFYTEGNIHAGEVEGSMSVMYLMDTLLSNTGKPEIAQLLKEHTFYLLPRVSPDGSEYYLTTPGMTRSSKRPYPFLMEMPGLQAQDLDGDGVIRAMRVRTPYGMWKVSPEDPRLMVRRLPDDMEGEFYNVYQEGMLVEYDGLNIKNAPQKYGYDFNRQYPADWKPAWEQYGAGETPLCNPETRANAEFLLAHRANVCACIDMHTFGGQVLYTPGSMSAKKADPQDMELYRTLGQMGHEATGYPLIQIHDEYMPQSEPETYGGFDDFCHFLIGVPCFTIECWDVEARAGLDSSYPPKENETEAERAANEKKLLKWIDENIPAGEGFKEWTAFEHPQLGPVEIGGIDLKFILQNAPIPFLTEEIEKHVTFMLRLSRALPRVRFETVQAERLADDLYRVEAVVGNRGFLPTNVFNQAMKDPAFSELTAEISGMEKMIEGEEKKKLGQLGGYGCYYDMGWSLPAKTVETSPVRKKLTWIVRAEAGTELCISLTGGKIGRVETKVLL